MKTEVKGKALADFEKIISEVDNASYSQGKKDGRKNRVDEYEQEIERYFEAYATEYTVLQFAECKTLSDFQDKLKEITLRSYNFQ